MQIRKLAAAEIAVSLRLAWAVFEESEAPDCSAEGIRTFRAFIRSEQLLEDCSFYGAYDGRELAGMIAVRDNHTHIALFFVPKQRQRQGVGRSLFAAVLMQCAAGTIAVNASRCAIGAYRKLGFTVTGSEQTVRGIRFTPMRYSCP
ncbi:MAG: GNAT family N-acetyltransferase [Sporomusaceae bacterium]|nr:GNAT family N-acetyltransferase [Sporomusaceae bacterium]